MWTKGLDVHLNMSVTLLTNWAHISDQQRHVYINYSEIIIY